MHSRTLILTAAVSLLAVTAAYADAPAAASTRIVLKHLVTKPRLQQLEPKPAARVAAESARTRMQYGSLEFGLGTVGTLTTGGMQQTVK